MLFTDKIRFAFCRNNKGFGEIKKLAFPYKITCFSGMKSRSEKMFFGLFGEGGDQLGIYKQLILGVLEIFINLKNFPLLLKTGKFSYSVISGRKTQISVAAF